MSLIRSMDIHDFSDFVEAWRDELLHPCTTVLHVCSPDNPVKIDEKDGFLLEGIRARFYQGTVLRSCARELEHLSLFCVLYKMSFDQKVVLSCWKSSVVIPVAKNLHPSKFDDYRPVALRFSTMKCFEWIVLKCLYSSLTSITTL